MIQSSMLAHRGGMIRGGWFDENLTKEIGDNKNSRFWLDAWVDGIILRNHFGRLFEVVVDKNKSVAEMIGEEGGLKKVN
ncbi:DNA-directed RNA polymerase [Trifolium pratense]|uniref:DNA-directed RNA polymerase n=1 Tax=Trifolium pratense TaxID=57577 RepID=A0A2K3MUV4_TRIPR|nr:DNA-directed RNA polymerase [Trifolium pratense]